MPKIRGIKPDLWTDENFVELSPYARLLWIGMWNHACDNGHLQDKSKQIKMRILPTDDVNAAELLREMEAQGLIERGDGWITIPNLTHHQKPHKRWYVVCDKPGCEHPEGASYGFVKPDKANPQRKSTVEQPLVNDETASHNGGSTADGDGDGDGELMVMVKNPLPNTSGKTGKPDRFDEFWDTYGHKVGRKRAETAYRAALRKPGITADLLIASAAAYITWQMSEGKHPEFTKHPTTWLQGEHWRDERPARRPEETSVQGWLRLAGELADDHVAPVHQIGGDR